MVTFRSLAEVPMYEVVDIPSQCDLKSTDNNYSDPPKDTVSKEQIVEECLTPVTVTKEQDDTARSHGRQGDTCHAFMEDKENTY